MNYKSPVAVEYPKYLIAQNILDNEGSPEWCNRIFHAIEPTDSERLTTPDINIWFNIYCWHDCGCCSRPSLWC